MVAKLTDVLAVIGILALEGIDVVVSFVANVVVVVVFGIVIELTTERVVIADIDTDAVVLAVVALVVTLDEVVEGVVIPVVRVIVAGLSVLGLVVAGIIVIFCTGTLAVDSSAAAVMFSVCAVAAGLVVAFVGFVVVIADVIAGDSADIVDAVTLVEPTEVVLSSAKVKCNY